LFVKEKSPRLGFGKKSGDEADIAFDQFETLNFPSRLLTAHEIKLDFTTGRGVAEGGEETWVPRAARGIAVTAVNRRWLSRRSRARTHIPGNGSSTSRDWLPGCGVAHARRRC
jgi:hypothetical protein